MLAELAALVNRTTAEALGFWLAPAPTAAANALAMLPGHVRALATHSAKNAIVDQSAAQSAMSEFS